MCTVAQAMVDHLDASDNLERVVSVCNWKKEMNMIETMDKLMDTMDIMLNELW